MKKYINIQAIIVIAIILFPVILHAQAPSDPGATDPDSVPIDGGLSLLVAAGVGYGAKKMKERRNGK